MIHANTKRRLLVQFNVETNVGRIRVVHDDGTIYLDEKIEFGERPAGMATMNIEIDAFHWQNIREVMETDG